jgi:aryl-alcohol dehydrogenase-like predicted oxidoreductase
MRTRKLGSSELEVSMVGLGCNNFGDRMDFDATRRVVHKALDLGITLFDTADSYGNRGGSEDFIGRLLGDRRKDVLLATKFGLPMDEGSKLQGASRRYITQAVEASLKRLRTDWIDLYQLHRPDPLTPIEETLRGLDGLVRHGKVRHIGCSNLAATELAAAQTTAERLGLTAFISCQNEYSLLARRIEQDLFPVMQRLRLGLLPYFPLASGLLTGKYAPDAPLPQNARLGYSRRHAADFINERNWDKVGKLSAFAARQGYTLLELAFAWLLSKPLTASVIAGASTAEQLEKNVQAAGTTLSSADLYELDAITL